MQRSYSLLALLLALALPPAACQGPRTTRPEQVRPSRHAALEPALNAEHYRLALSIDPAERSIEGTFSWETPAAAARLRVSLSEDGVAWIEEALRRESPHDTLRASLFELLAEQDDLRVVGILRAWVSDESVSAKARGSAAEALAVVSRDDPETSALLASFMEDAPNRLQYAAVNGLASSRERTARRVLAKSYPSMTDPRQRRVVEAAFREAD